MCIIEGQIEVQAKIFLFFVVKVHMYCEIITALNGLFEIEQSNFQLVH